MGSFIYFTQFMHMITDFINYFFNIEDLGHHILTGSVLGNYSVGLYHIADVEKIINVYLQYYFVAFSVPQYNSL